MRRGPVPVLGPNSPTLHRPGAEERGAIGRAPRQSVGPDFSCVTPQWLSTVAGLDRKPLRDKAFAIAVVERLLEADPD